MSLTRSGPSAVQAFDNRRFIQRFGTKDTAGETDWGRALDLYLFATSSTDEPIGGRERVVLRLQSSLFEANDEIRFDYLDTVSNLRGDTPNRDDDEAFLEFIKGGRDVDHLVAEMCR